MTPSEKFYANVRKVMIDKNIKRATLANRMGVTYKALNAYFTNKSAPTLSTILQFCKALKTPIEKLMEGVDKCDQ